MKSQKHLLVISLLLLTLCSCSDMTDMEYSPINQDVKYVLMVPAAKPIQLTEAQKTFAADNNQFALNFLQTVAEASQRGVSFIYSPLSITYALGMVNDAAQGQTRQELEQTLGFHEGGIEAVNEYCKMLIEKLPKVDESLELSIANAIFLNKQYTLKQQFLQDMQHFYHAQAEALDFSLPTALGHINGWCSEQTHGMITTILDKVEPTAVSYLLNAIYLRADWTSKFDERLTATETFTAEDGTQGELPLMHQNAVVNYARNDVFSIVDIPYGNSMWSMTVMLPEKGKTTGDVIRWLAANGWTISEWDNTSPLYVSPYGVDLKLPRFNIKSDTNLPNGQTLINLLQTMGLQKAFTPMAEIPNMCEQGNVFISMMRQKAAIEVDERGAEATAVTDAESTMTHSGEEPDGTIRTATFHANRPFVYVIRERSSGVLLFVGRFSGE